MKDLRHLLSKKEFKKYYYITQEEIDKYHPLYLENRDEHSIMETAMILVSERYEKYELVDLVNYLLHKIHDKEEIRIEINTKY